MRIQVVIDESGRIVAAAHIPAAPDVNEPQAGVYALPGQRVTEVDVPYALRELDTPRMLRGILDHRLHADGTRLEASVKE